MKKFAVIQMGPNYIPQQHQAQFDLPGMSVLIRTVRDFDEAIICVDQLVADGVTCMELCGAFGKERAQQLIERTGGNIAIGYCVNMPEQTEMFQQFFCP